MSLAIPAFTDLTKATRTVLYGDVAGDGAFTPGLTQVCCDSSNTVWCAALLLLQQPGVRTRCSHMQYSCLELNKAAFIKHGTRILSTFAGLTCQTLLLRQGACCGQPHTAHQLDVMSF
jgi:hypothetical protein